MGNAGAGPREPVRGFDNAAQVRDLVRQVLISHAPEIEDDDQGPFLVYEDAESVANALWPRIATLTRERDEALGELADIREDFDSWEDAVLERDEALAKLVSREAEVVELREALYPLVVGCFEADAHEDAPEFSNGEASRGRDALGDCPKCCGSGSTDGDFYEDQPIPIHLVCPDCGGWGFLKHQTGTTGALDRVLAEHDKAVEVRVAERCAEIANDETLCSPMDIIAAIRREFGVTR